MATRHRLAGTAVLVSARSPSLTGSAVAAPSGTKAVTTAQKRAGEAVLQAKQRPVIGEEVLLRNGVAVPFMVGGATEWDGRLPECTMQDAAQTQGG
jgi:hypothetical protein